MVPMRPMAHENPTADAAPRYSHKKAVEEVEWLRRDLGLSQKEVALGSGVTESEYSQKKRGVINSFSLEEFSALAEFFRKKTGRPLIGWPVLDRTTVDAIDRKVAGWKPSIR